MGCEDPITILPFLDLKMCSAALFFIDTRISQFRPPPFPFILYIAVYLALSQSSYVMRDHILNDPPTHIPLVLTLIIKLMYVYSLSIPRILRANCISLGMIVTLLPCIAHKLASSNNATKCASLASCNASIALPCHR